MKKTNRKTLRLIAVCAALVLVASVAGTVAYLTDKTEAVHNTFTIGKLLDDPDDFVLLEHEAADTDLDGVYTLGDKEVTGNEYTVLPGVNLPKDPFVRTDDELNLDAYVFIEVVEDDFGTALSYTVDTNNWTLLSGETGPEGGKVYVMKANNGIAKAGSKLDPVTILKDDQITVANATFVSDGDAIKKFGGSVSFYGYMIQAGGFTGAAAAWDGYMS